MASGHRDTPTQRMRPNIQISHALNGRVRDYAAEHDLTAPEAYERIIKTGLEELEDSEPDGQKDSEPAGHEASETARQLDEDSHGSEAPNPLDDVEFPSTVDRDEAELAVIAAREFIKRDGPVTMREIVATVMPDKPLGYDVPDLEPGERYRGSWWRNIVKPGLKAYPDIDSPSDGESEWTWVGEKE